MRKGSSFEILALDIQYDNHMSKSYPLVAAIVGYTKLSTETSFIWHLTIGYLSYDNQVRRSCNGHQSKL